MSVSITANWKYLFISYNAVKCIPKFKRNETTRLISPTTADHMKKTMLPPLSEKLAVILCNLIKQSELTEISYVDCNSISFPNVNDWKQNKFGK